MNLANPKHELVAKALARGATYMDAVTQAGFTGINKTQAEALCKSPKIVNRTKQIMDELEDRLALTADTLEDMDPEAVQRLITESWIIKELVVSIKQSQVAGQFNATKALLEMLGKEIGMFGGNGSNGDEKGRGAIEDKSNIVINLLQNIHEVSSMSEELKDVTPDSKFKTKQAQHIDMITDKED